jgi:hypothetical protein
MQKLLNSPVLAASIAAAALFSSGALSPSAATDAPIGNQVKTVTLGANESRFIFQSSNNPNGIDMRTIVIMCGGTNMMLNATGPKGLGTYIAACAGLDGAASEEIGITLPKGWTLEAVTSGGTGSATVYITFDNLAPVN